MVPYNVPASATSSLEALAAAQVGDLKATASGLWGSAAFDGVGNRPDQRTVHKHMFLRETRAEGGYTHGQPPFKVDGAIVATPLRIDKYGT